MFKRANLEKHPMKKSIVAFFAVAAFASIATLASEEHYKMDGNSLVSSVNSTVGKIEGGRQR